MEDLRQAIVDIFVYVVVLNLFAQYLPRIIAETFTISLLTAVLLKLVLEVVVLAKSWAWSRFRVASGAPGKVLGALLLWLILFGSKFLVLEIVAQIFGCKMQLGGFFSVTALIITLMLCRAATRRWLLPPTNHATTDVVDRMHVDQPQTRPAPRE